MSIFQTELKSFLKTQSPDITSNHEGPFISFFDPTRNVSVQAVDIATFNSTPLPSDYFIQQIDQQAALGIRVVFCWEDLWIKKRSIIKSRIQSLYGNSRSIHGRQCTIKKVSRDEMGQFLHENHLLGNAKGKYNLGLYRENVLVAVAVFARSVPVQRQGITYKSHEMIRFCSLCGHYVQGGLSKLLKVFIEMKNPDDIYTVVDRDWSDGEAFRKLGFIETGTSLSHTFWLDNDLHRIREKPFDGAKKVANAGNIQLLLPLKP